MMISTQHFVGKKSSINPVFTLLLSQWLNTISCLPLCTLAAQPWMVGWEGWTDRWTGDVKEPDPG